MTLKSSFSNQFFPRLLGRFYQFNWLTALWSVALFFVFPVAGALIFTISFIDGDVWTVSNVGDVIAGQIGTACILTLFMAVLTPNTFNYLNSRKQLDFYHSQPVSRKELFWRNYLVGSASFLIPLTVAFALDFGIVLLIPGIGWSNVITFVKGYFACAGTYFTANALCLLAVMLCGNRFISLLTGIYFCGLPAMMFGMAMYFITSYSNTFAYEGVLYDILGQITPICYFVDFVADHDNAFGVYFWATLVWVLIGVGIVFASLGLYLRRKSETAGKSLSFTKAIVGIKYPLTIFIAWIGGLLFEAMGGALWMVFGFAVFGTLTFCIVGGLEKFEFKGAFRGFGKLALTVGIYLLCVVVIFSSCIVFDRRTTDDKHIKSVDVDYISYTEYLRGGATYDVANLKNIEGEEAIKAINYIATLAAKNEHSIKKSDRISLSGLFGSDNIVLEDGDGTAQISLTVTMHTSFGSYKRIYRLRTEIDEEIFKRLRTFSVSPGAKKASAEQTLSLIEGYSATDKFSFIASDEIPGKKIMKSLYEALREDMKNAKVEDYEKECLGSVRIHFKYAPYYYNEDMVENTVVDVPVFPCYKETLKIVEKYGCTLYSSNVCNTVGSFGTNDYYTDSDYNRGFENGWNAGQESGKSDGEKGAAYNEYKGYGDNSSYGEGYTIGFLQGYDEGYNIYGDAYNQGHRLGLAEGEAKGLSDREAGNDFDDTPLGDFDIFTEYRNGYYDGYIKGYNLGYEGLDYKDKYG